MHKPINVLGWFDKGNTGDESYKLAFPLVFPDHKFIFTRSLTSPLPEVVILGGGDVISEPYLNKIKDVKNKHVISCSLSSCGPRNCKTVALRDKASQALAASLGIESTFCPDLAFALTYNRTHGLELISSMFDKHHLELYEKRVCCVINRHLVGEYGGISNARESQTFEKFAYDLAEVCDTTSASFIFVPFGYAPPWDDRVTNGWIASKCKFFQKNLVIYDNLTVQDTIDIISACDAVVSTRLHSSIFSCLTGTPLLDVIHNHKNQAFIDTYNLQEMSIKFGAGYEEIFKKLQNTITNAEEVRATLLKITERNKILLREISQDVRFV